MHRDCLETPLDPLPLCFLEVEREQRILRVAEKSLAECRAHETSPSHRETSEPLLKQILNGVPGLPALRVMKNKMN